jgi:predicted nucleic acid-binding protein
VIVDTSVWVDFFADRPTWQADRLASDVAEERLIGLTDVVYTEVLQGIQNDAHLRFTERKLLEFPILRLEGLDDFRMAVQLYRAARRSGHTIRNTTDCLIAAVCVRERRPLLHNDVDFDRLAACSDLVVVPPG